MVQSSSSKIIMLDVYLHNLHVGTLDYINNDLAFTYNELALDNRERSRISVHLPVQEEPYPSREFIPFLDNLLPESDVRDLIARITQYDASDVERLLGAIGGECAGAISLWPKGESPPSTAEYKPCSAKKLYELFDIAHSKEFGDAHVSGRQSMSGAQHKLVLLKRADKYLLPKRGAPTTILVKRARNRFPGIVYNEITCLKLLQAIGFTVAEGGIVRGEPNLFESVRYDRSVSDNGITKIHQEDLCQATGNPARRKYSGSGGPGYDSIRTILQRHGASPANDIATIVKWAVANICIGNNDAHAKNLSFLHSEDGIRIAPIYDVICTRVYPKVDTRFGMSFGGAVTVNALNANAVRKFSRSLGVGHRLVANSIDDVTTGLLSSLDDTCDDVIEKFGEHKIISQINDITRSIISSLRKNVLK